MSPAQRQSRWPDRSQAEHRAPAGLGGLGSSGSTSQGNKGGLRLGRSLAVLGLPGKRSGGGGATAGEVRPGRVPGLLGRELPAGHSRRTGTRPRPTERAPPRRALLLPAPLPAVRNGRSQEGAARGLGSRGHAAWPGVAAAGGAWAAQSACLARGRRCPPDAGPGPRSRVGAETTALPAARSLLAPEPG